MTTYVMPELTKEEIRKMTKSVVQGVAAKKIVSSVTVQRTKQIHRATVVGVGAPKGDSGFVARNASSALTPHIASGRELAGSVLSQARGREILKTAFKKAR